MKLRLGQLNSEGQQKGVDSLIVTDLIELARNKAISDAVVLTGDEDIRVGVQIAQSLGVRVHLLGIGGAQQGKPITYPCSRKRTRYASGDKPEVELRSCVNRLSGCEATMKKFNRPQNLKRSRRKQLPNQLLLTPPKATQTAMKI